MSADATATPVVTAADRWRVHPHVSVRPETFGALLYHCGTRRLTFLKDRRLLAILDHMQVGASVVGALEETGIEAGEHRRYLGALQRLADTNMIEPAPQGRDDG